MYIYNPPHCLCSESKLNPEPGGSWKLIKGRLFISWLRRHGRETVESPFCGWPEWSGRAWSSWGLLPVCCQFPNSSADSICDTCCHCPGNISSDLGKKPSAKEAWEDCLALEGRRTTVFMKSGHTNQWPVENQTWEEKAKEGKVRKEFFYSLILLNNCSWFMFSSYGRNITLWLKAWTMGMLPWVFCLVEMSRAYLQANVIVRQHLFLYGPCQNGWALMWFSNRHFIGE